MGLTEEGDELEERDETKVALEEALRRIRGLKADEGEQEQETYFVTLEAEVLDDGVFKQFTQLGAGSEDKVTGVFNKGFFRSILPTYMPDELYCNFGVELRHSALLFFLSC